MAIADTNILIKLAITVVFIGNIEKAEKNLDMYRISTKILLTNDLHEMKVNSRTNNRGKYDFIQDRGNMMLPKLNLHVF